MELHSQAVVVDAHCDTIHLLIDLKEIKMILGGNFLRVFPRSLG